MKKYIICLCLCFIYSSAAAQNDRAYYLVLAGFRHETNADNFAMEMGNKSAHSPRVEGPISRQLLAGSSCLEGYLEEEVPHIRVVAFCAGVHRMVPGHPGSTRRSAPVEPGSAVRGCCGQVESRC